MKMNVSRYSGLLIIIFMICFVGSGFVAVNSLGDEVKVDSMVYEALDEEDEIRVVVKLSEGGIFESQDSKDSKIENIIEKVDEENVKHIFSDEIALEVDRNELSLLKMDENI
ncbi:hypothetical protein HOG16_03945, partial [Candidatus Woesearchaeota archaeon]|nr:hypothetical protein [Candidatus Woesearchaeota archaeon]